MAGRSLRQQRLSGDVELITRTCVSDNNCPFCKFEFNDGLFSFEFHSLATKTFYWIAVSDDYPDHSVVTWCNNDSDATHKVSHVNERLPIVFNQIAKKLYKDLKLTVADDSCLVSNSSQLTSSSLTSSSSTSTAGTAAVKSSSSTCQSVHQSRHCQPRIISSDDDDDNDDDEDDMYDDGDEYANDGSDETCMNTQLIQDIAAVKAIYGDASIETRIYSSIDDCDVELRVPISTLDDVVVRAWRFIPNRPLLIILHFSMSGYRNVEQPKVEVYQYNSVGVKEQYGVHCQLEKILERFLFESWAGTSAVVSSSTDAVCCSHQVASGEPANKCQSKTPSDKQVLYSNNQSVTHSNASSDASAKIARLVELGVSQDEAAKALCVCNDDIDAAAELLLTASNSADIAKPGLGKKDEKLTKVHQLPKHLENKKKISTVSRSEDRKKIPSPEHGFLVQVIKYVLLRLQTLNEFCVICDETHVFESSSMLKPTVCSRDLCVFAFQTLGVMSNAADDIATAAEVVDLLIAMANAACRSGRRSAILEPYPTVVHPTQPNVYVFHPKSKDFDKVQRTLDIFPAMSEMINKSSAELKRNMDKRDPYAYPLLQWIISSNRCHIVKLSPAKQLDFMRTPHQFLLRSSPPAKEAAFNEARKQHGSTFAFHGSHIENWHSIVRRGLLNASGTSLQLNGAAYGAGVYLSPCVSISFNYSAVRHIQPTASSSAKNVRFLSSKNITCIALCEVVTSEQLRKNGTIWVMPEPNHVCTRFFFVYEGNIEVDQTTHTQSRDIREKITDAMHLAYG
jgi:poly [ADP-ribose] polymerase 6/8